MAGRKWPILLTWVILRTVAATNHGSPQNEHIISAIATTSKSKWYLNIKVIFGTVTKRRFWKFQNSWKMWNIWDLTKNCIYLKRTYPQLFFSLFSFLFTITVVICWSMNTKIVDKSENGSANPIVQGGLNLTGSIHHPKMNIFTQKWPQNDWPKRIHP